MKKPTDELVKTDEPPQTADDKKPTPTADELEARAKEVVASMFPAPGGAKKVEPKKEEPVAPPPPLPTAAPAAPTAAPEPSAKKPLPPPIAEAIKPESLQVPPPAKLDVKPTISKDLTEEDLETLDVLAQMVKDGKADPAIVERTKKFWADETAYIAKWTKENPGEKFDADSMDHSEFYENNEPKYDEREFKRAQKVRVEEKIEHRIEEKIKKETEVQMYQRDLREQAPKTAAAVGDAIVEMVAEAGFKELMQKDGKLVLSKEIEDEIDKASPHARTILMDEAELLSAQIAEIDKLQHFPGKYQIEPGMSVKLGNGAYIQPHRMLTDFAVNLERDLASLPPQDTVRNGKRFATQTEFTVQVNRIMASPLPVASKQAEFDRLTAAYYTVGWEDIKVALIAQHSTHARAKIDQFGGINKTVTAPPAAKAGAPAPAPSMPEFRSGGKAPSLSSASENTDTARKTSFQSGKTADDIVRAMFT
jgi:hypothetical protein